MRIPEATAAFLSNKSLENLKAGLEDRQLSVNGKKSKKKKHTSNSARAQSRNTKRYQNNLRQYRGPIMNWELQST